MFQKTRNAALGKIRASTLAAGLIVLLASSGCTDPCQALAEKICSCELNSSEENACLEQVRAGEQRPVSDAENEACARLVDSCTCDVLELNDLAACGLSKAPETPMP